MQTDGTARGSAPGTRMDADAGTTQSDADRARTDAGTVADGTTRDGKSTLSGIGAVAGRTGVSERTLRYYEELGLLRPTAHRRGGSRLYCEADVERVAHIRELQALMGFNLEEIRGIVAAMDRLDALRDEYKGTADSGHQRELLEEAARALEDLRGQVMAKRDHLESFLAKLDARIERNRKRLACGTAEPPGPDSGREGTANGTDPLAYGVSSASGPAR
jgi:DNA-binding transcriptional MerR regulator